MKPRLRAAAEVHAELALLLAAREGVIEPTPFDRKRAFACTEPQVEPVRSMFAAKSCMWDSVKKKV